MNILQIFRNLIKPNRNISNLQAETPILSQYEYDTRSGRFDVSNKILEQNGFNYFKIDNKILIFMTNSKAFVGSEYGKAVYNELKLNEIINKYGNVEIHFSNDIVAVNPSFISPIIEALVLNNPTLLSNSDILFNIIKFSSYMMDEERLEKNVMEGYIRVKRYSMWRC